MICKGIRHTAALFVALAWMGAAFAAEEGCTSQSGDCVAVGHWNFSVALGAGVRTNPLARSQDIPLIVVPQFSYYGKRFFIDNLDPGFTLFEGDTNTISLVASPGYDRVFFYRSDLQNFFIGLPQPGGGASGSTTGNVLGRPTPPPKTREVPVPASPRRVTYLAGPEWTFKYAGVTGQLDYLHEITERNHGDEVRAALGIPLGHLGGSWTTNLGFTWKSAGIVNYYYGVPDTYGAGSALNPFAKIGYSRPLSKKWKLDAFVHCERMGGAIYDSPIVGHRFVFTAFIGATHVFHK